jgi:hypothetical protein
MGLKNNAKYNIICFGFLPWSNMWKRNQSMMAALATCDFINRVVFVNPIFSILNALKIKNGKFYSTLGIKNKLITKKVSSNIFVFTPKNIFPDRKYFAQLKNIEKRIIAKISLKIIKRLNSDKPFILIMNCPNVFSNDLIDILIKDAHLSIFDFSDDFLELGYIKETIESFKRNIEKYSRVADIVITVNEHLRLKYRVLNPNIYVIRNATNYSNFDRKKYKKIECLEKLKRSNSPIIGYSGIANMSRLDENILDFIIKQRPDWKFIFIGYAKKEFSLKYLNYKNVHHIAPVDYISLPDYMQYFDVAIVPFKINSHTMGNDLLKFHDFLAMGKPVVSTEIGGAEDLKDVIRIANSPSIFLEEIEKALCNETNDAILRRKKIAQKNSWYNRINEFKLLLRDYLNI